MHPLEFSWQTQDIHFVHRRAWWVGHVGKHDLSQAFGFSDRTAARRMLAALENTDPHGFPYLLRRGSRIVPNPLAERHPCAGEEHLLATLAHQKLPPALFFCLTGLREEELSLHRIPGLKFSPSTPRTFDVVLRALLKKPQVVEARYIPSTPGAPTQGIVFVPLGLQISGARVSLYVQCLERQIPGSPPLKVFEETSLLLTHLSHAKNRVSSKKTRDSLRRLLPNFKEPTVLHQVHLHPLLTSDQAGLVRHRLGLNASQCVERPASNASPFLHGTLDFLSVSEPTKVEPAPIPHLAATPSRTDS